MIDKIFLKNNRNMKLWDIVYMLNDTTNWTKHICNQINCAVLIILIYLTIAMSSGSELFLFPIRHRVLKWTRKCSQKQVIRLTIAGWMKNKLNDTWPYWSVFCSHPRGSGSDVSANPFKNATRLRSCMTLWQKQGVNKYYYCIRMVTEDVSKETFQLTRDRFIFRIIHMYYHSLTILFTRCSTTSFAVNSRKLFTPTTWSELCVFPRVIWLSSKIKKIWNVKNMMLRGQCGMRIRNSG